MGTATVERILLERISHSQINFMALIDHRCFDNVPDLSVKLFLGF